jgi:hypothetical protein
MSNPTTIEEKRAERKAANEAARLEQRAKDLEAIDALEQEFGDSNIATLDVPYSPGLPTMIACRTPNEAEIKRYRHELKAKKDGTMGDPVTAAELVAATCRVYPPRGKNGEASDGDELYRKMLAARPGIHVQLGAEALKLASASAEDRSKS